MVFALAFAGSTCRLDELIKTPIDGTLTIAPLAVGDSAARGSLALRIQSIELTTAGTARLSFRATRAQGSGWLALSATTGTAPDTLTATFDPAGLATGVYQDTIVVTSSNSASPAVRVPVTFTVYDCRVTPIAADTTVSGAITTGDCGAPHRAGRFARLYSFPGIAGDSVSFILNGTGFDAYLVLDTALAPAATPVVEMDDCLGVTGDACVIYHVLPTSGTYRVEVTTSAPAQTGGYMLSLRPPLSPIVPDSVRQLRADSVTPIATGDAIAQTGVVLRATVQDSDLADSVRIEVEVRPMGVPFTGTPTGVSPRVARGQRALVLVPGLSDDLSYHWQIRAADGTGRSSSWTSYGGNSETAPDFSVVIPQPPAPPAGLAQVKADGTTPIPVGGANQTRSVVLKGLVTDPDPGGQLRLEVELQPVNIALKDSANGNVTVANGDTAVVTIPGLTNNVSYHWQARTVDLTGRASAWTAFGGNPPSATDFSVSIQATQLIFTTQPTTTAAGAAITPAVQVTAHDALGAAVTGFADTVTITLAANPAGGTLSGVVRAAAVNGVATFADLRLDRAGAGYALRATSPSLTSTSASFAIVPGSPSQLVFTQQPVSTTAGATIAPPVQVAAKDASGNVVIAYAGSITVSLNPSPGALLGTVTRTAVGGVATFDDLRINAAAAGYTLTVGDGSIVGTSQSFDILPQGAARLAFTVEPIDAVAGTAIAPPVKVSALDSLGNTVTGFTGNITVGFAANPGGGALRGATTVGAVAGVATFTTLSIDKTGAGYTLTATAAAAASVTSAPFDITPAPAHHLTFIVQPSTATAGNAIVPGIQVSVRDSLGNAVPNSGDSITVAIGVNPGSATLSGTRTVAATGGVATFADLSIDRATTGYTLTGAAAGLIGATSTTFDVLPGPAARLKFTIQPSTTAAGSPIAPAVELTARDAFGNTASGFNGSVTVALAVNPSAGLLIGTTTVSAAAGIATFANLAIDRAGAGYTLAASGSGLAGDTSAAFTITAGSAGGLDITTPPSATAQSGIALVQQPAVQLEDQNGNPVNQAGVQITAGLATGASTATLAGGTAITDAAGVATFSGLTISGPAGNYTLVFGGSGLTPATSGTVTLAAGTAAKLGLTTQPSPVAQNGLPFPQQPVVQVQDAAGNAVPQSGIAVAAAIASGGGALSGTTPTATDGLGQAAFADLAITGLVGKRTLSFTAAALAGVTSDTVTLDAGAATQIALSTGDGQTATAGTAVAIPPAVVVRDQSGNPVGGVDVTFAVVSGGGAVNPTTPVLTGGNGVAAATAWTLGPTAGLNGLSADAPGLSGTPVLFSATAIVGAAANLAKSSGDNLTGPVLTTLGTPHEVLITDANGNPVLGVTVNWSVPAGQGGVNPTSSITDNNGHAQTTRTLGAAVGTQTTNASATLSGGLTSVTFTITATAGGASTMLKFAGDGQVDTVGATLATPIAVRVTDAGGNAVQGVQITWSVLDGGGSVGSPTSFTDVNGVATTSWTLGTQMTAGDSTQLVQATGPGQAANFVATTRPGGVHADSSLVTVSPATIPVSSGASQATITVTARDGFGNRIPGKTVALAVTGTGNTLAQPGAATDQNGIANGTLSSTVAEVKTVSATAAGVALTPTPTLTVQPGSGAALQFLVQPVSATSGVAIAPPVQVEVLDAFGNRATGSTAGITIQFGNNPTAANLGGTTFQMAVAGVATFNDLSVDKAGSGYSLTATAPPRTPDISVTFDIAPGSPALVAVSAGNNQTAVVNSDIATPPSVRVTDANGNGVPGVAMTFTPSGTGSVTGGAAVTDASGFATVGSWTLSTVAGANTLTAAVSGILPATITATGAPGPVSAAQSGVVAVPGTIAAGTGSATITVTVRDQFNNTIPNATVVLAASGTANTLTQPSAPTDASGNATGTLASTLAEMKTVTATANGVALTAAPTVTVTAGAVSATRTTIAATPATLTASTGSNVSTITVTARDANDNPVSGAGVVLAATGAGNALTQPAVSTDLAGVVTGSLSSTAPGVKTVSAMVNGVSITQTAAVTVNPGAATQLAFRTNPTSAVAGVAISPAVEVSARDALNNRDSTFTGNVTVAFFNNAGGGTLAGTTTVAAVKGLAVFPDLSVDKAGTGYTLTATGGGLTAATSLTFDITAAAAAAIAVNGGDGQSAAAGTAVAVPPSVVVRDAFANPVAGVAVTFAVATGGGSVNPTSPIVTNASGVAPVTSWTLGTSAGPNTLTATASGLAGSPVTFTATATAGAATTIALAGGNTQTDTAAAALAVPYTVLVTDASANPVSGVTVTWAVTGGGGSITPSSTTNGSGIASATRVLGSGAGPQTATATVNGLTGSPVMFTATATHAHAAQIALNNGNSQTATVNTAVTTPPSVIVRDQFNNVVAGASVTFSVIGGAGTVVPATPVTTDAAGIAVVTSWTLGTTAGASNNTLIATATGLTGSPVAFTASATAGAATQIAVNAGDNQSAQVNSAVPVAPSVIVRDQFNNGVAGVSVTFAVASGGGVVNPTTSLVTNASGVAQVTSWTVGASAGTNTLTATAGGLTGSPITFTATGFAGSATQIALNGGDAQTDTVGATLPVVYSVIVRDASNNPVQGVPVGWAVTGGGGSILPATSNTNASGIATAARTFGTTAGSHTATAAVGGLSGSPITFSATATHGVASQIGVNAGNNQTATVNTGVATAPSAIVHDQFGNPVSGVAVTFAVGSGGGSATGGGTTTDASGIATVGSWTLGTAAGTNTVTATSGGLTGSPVTFTATGTAGAVSSSQSTVVAAPGGITASSGSSASTITVTARDAFGNPISGAAVVLSATPTSGNTLTQPGATDGSGVATGTLSSTVAETKTVSATANGTLVTQTATVTVTTDGVVSATQSSVAAAPGTLTAGGGAATITVTARDAFNNPIGGAAVVLATSGSGNVLTQPTDTTHATGVTAGTLSATVAETKTVSATINGTAVTQTALVTVTAGAVSDAQSTVVAAPDTIAASAGSSTSTITINARDAFNNPVSGATVVLAATGSGNTLTQPAATNGAGVTTGTLFASVAESKVLSATINGTAITQTDTVTVTVGAVSAGQSTVSAAPATITAGSGSATITVTARDAFANAISGATVVLGATPATGNTLTQPGSVTDGGGVATGALSSTAAEPKIVSATINGTLVTQTDTVTVTTDGIVSAAQSTVAAAPGTITASAGSSASTITVTARDQFGNAIPGAAVSLAATGSANSFAPAASGTANGSGVFSAAFSSTTAEVKTASATIDGTAINQTATVLVVPAAVSAGLSTVAATPDTIGATTGTQQATVTVTARDAFGNAVAGATVVLAATGTGNTLTQPAAVTDPSGVATGTLSSTATGAKTVSATVASVAITGTDTVVVVPGPADAATSTLSASATNLTASTGASASNFTVTARDALGNLISGSTVTLSVSGTGNALTQPAAPTNASGQAVGTLSSTVAETKTVSATVGAVTLNQTATITVAPAAAFRLKFVGQPTTAAVNTFISPAILVASVDTFGNVRQSGPSRSITLSFVSNPGGSAISGTNPKSTPSGGVPKIAVFDSISLNQVGIGYRLQAGTPSLNPDTSAAFSIVAGPAASIALFAGNAQTDTVGATLATPYQVRVADAFNNPVSGVTVSWAVTSGGGSIASSSVTNALGLAAATHTLGTGSGSQTATAAVTGLSGTPVTFTATAAAGTATSMALSAGNAQTDTVGATLPVAYAVLVSDGFGNPKSGITVTWSVTGGGGSITPSSITNGSGIAVATRVLGTAPGTGTHTAQAAVAGLTGSPVAFSASATTGTAATIALSAGDAQIDTVGATLPVAYAVLVSDGFGNPKSGITVTWSVTGGGGSVTPSSITTGSGIAVATRVLGTAPGTNTHTAQAAVAGLTGSPVGFTASATTGTAATIALSAGNAQADTAGATLPVAYAVLVADGFGNPKSGTTVTWTITGGGGSITPSSITDNSGIAVATRVLGTSTSPSTHTAQAAVAGLAGSPVAFTASATAGTATTIGLNAGNAQTDTVGATLAVAYAVLVTDGFGNPKSSVTVSWSVTGGGGSITPSSVTNGAGIAVATRVLGPIAGTGTHTAEAAVGSLSGSPVQFTASATAGTAAILALAGGNGQADTVDAVLAPYTVLVTDGFGNAKAGMTVDWTVTSGGGSIPASSVTNGSGIATATATLGTASGSQVVEATVTGLSGSPVVFTATVNPGNGTALVYTVQPSTTPAGNTIAPPIQVRVRDRHGNVATGYVGTVTVAIAPLTGNPAGVLLGTTTRTVVGGVAVFDDLSITLPNTLLPAYRLDATSGTLPLVTSISFNIT